MSALGIEGRTGFKGRIWQEFKKINLVIIGNANWQQPSEKFPTTILTTREKVRNWWHGCNLCLWFYTRIYIYRKGGSDNRVTSQSLQSSSSQDLPSRIGKRLEGIDQKRGLNLEMNDYSLYSTRL